MHLERRRRLMAKMLCIFRFIDLDGSAQEEDPDLYYIENVYVDAESEKEMDPPEEIEEIVNTGSVEPLFQLITPNICNNIDLDSPLGISVYANAIRRSEGNSDLVYDSYMNEFVLGRKRIMVPISQAKRQMQEDGVSAPVFDPNDAVYYLASGRPERKQPADRSGHDNPSIGSRTWNSEST